MGLTRSRVLAFIWFCLGALSALLLASAWLLAWEPFDSGSAGATPHTAAAPFSALAARAVRLALRRPRVVASFTTFPLGQRMKGVGEMLRSLSNQTWLPDAVIVNLPDRIERLSTGPLAIPPEVNGWLQQYSWLKVHQTKDYGPATKLLGALEVEKDPDTIIVILDDDTYYHYDTVLVLVSAMLASSAAIAPCFQCEEVRRDWRGAPRWGYAAAEGACRGFASGYAAYAVRPRYFGRGVWDLAAAPAGCRLHDDVWISGCMLVAAGVRPHLVRPGFDSVTGAFIKDAGGRQPESVFVANQAAHESGQDPQGSCVAHFPFDFEVRRFVL